MKKAFVFPGQGAQFVGMGKDLYENSPEAKELFEKANEILGFRITDLMFNGTDEDLKQTKVTQPAIFLHSVILANSLTETPDMVAGHSLGEFSALVAAKALSFEDGLRLVHARALAMQKACEANPSTMAAVIGTADEKVEAICKEIDEVVVPANYNCPGQIVISGSNKGIETACQKLTEAGESDIDRKVLSFLSTEEGKTYWFDGDSYWRVMVFIPRAKTYETVNPEYSNYAGQAFGNFQAMLADIPETLGETIPDFHNMEFRLKQLRDAVATNAAGRVAEVQYYLDEIEKRADEMCKAERLYREGKLPKRVCHCDTKVNNMMFDEDGKVLCVIDLDTVMPSFIFSDYGDFLRTGANTGDEDDKDLDRVNFNMEIFKAFTKGYLEGAKSFLTPIEIENLPYAAALFPYMQCVRFLADYINGDTYYKIKYPEHNLVRTKAQFKLLQSVEEHTPEMVAFINECLKK